MIQKLRPKSLSSLVSGVYIVGFLSFIIIFLTYFAQVSYVRDSFYLKTSFYFEFEHLANKVLSSLRRVEEHYESKKTEESNQIIEITENDKNPNEMKKLFDAYSRKADGKGILLTQFRTKNLVFLPNASSSKKIKFAIIPIKFWQKILNLDEKTHFWIQTRDAEVMYSNAQTAAGILKAHPLVQRFIQSKLNSGFHEYERNGIDYIGYFYSIPKTNLFLLTEMSQTQAFRNIRSTLLRLLGLALGIGLIIYLLNQFILTRVLAPLKNMTRLAYNISNGDYTTKLDSGGQTEIGILSRALLKMQDALSRKDRHIAELLSETAQKTQLETELKILEQVQSNLLPKKDLDERSDLKIATKYQPSAYASGDWYTFHYNPESQETVVMIVDVSGHGAGPAMFTTAIATQFDNFIRKIDDSPDYHEFIAIVDKTLLALGNKKWMATIIMTVYKNNSQSLRILSAGHTPAMYLDHSATTKKRKLRAISLPSNPVGIDSLMISETEVAFDGNQRLILYTDGITEASNSAGKEFGKRPFRKIIAELKADLSERYVVDQLYDRAKTFSGKESFEDDVCIIAIGKK